MKQNEKPPSRGEGLLVCPKGTNEQLVHVLGMAVLALCDVLRHLPTSFVYRCNGPKKGLVFSEPAPRPLVEMILDLLDGTEEPVRIEGLDLAPVMRLSKAGIRIYVYEPEQEATGLPN